MKSTQLSTLWSCGFRPFFLLSAIYACLLLLVWIGFWSALPVLPSTLGGPIVWHAHELLYGFTLAAILGFLTTAVPEFTGKKEIQKKTLMLLVLLWLLARLCFWMSGVWGVWPAALSNSAVVASLLVYLIPAIWNDPGRRHMAFVYSVLILFVLQLGFYHALVFQTNPMPWLNASIGAVMVLIVSALSRISMRAINGLEDGIDINDEKVEYLARPPRRNLATVCIALYTALEFSVPGNSASAWVALAAAAAMLNLLNDWHIGRALFNPWIFAMYSVYWLMALGYGLLGFDILFQLGLSSAARHLLTIGAMGLSILVVQLFAGQVHCGRQLRYQQWMTGALLALLVAIAARLLMPVFVEHYQVLLLVSASAWVLSFALFFYKFLPILVAPAADGRSGC